MMYCEGIPDKPAVMQSNYTVIVMGLKPHTPSKHWPQLRASVYAGLLISCSDPGSDWTFNYPSSRSHTHWSSNWKAAGVFRGIITAIRGAAAFTFVCVQSVCHFVVESFRENKKRWKKNRKKSTRGEKRQASENNSGNLISVAAGLFSPSTPLSPSSWGLCVCVCVLGQGAEVCVRLGSLVGSNVARLRIT